jgi:hypothetical protein
MSTLGAWTGVIGGARAIGNEAVAEAATRSMERDCATGARFPDRPLNAGVQSIAVALWPRWGQPMSLGQLTLRGYVAPRGPILEHAPWPAVIVTKARCDDGASLDWIVEPYTGDAATPRDFKFRALTPNSAYRLHGSGVDLSMLADAEGCACVSFTVPARLDLRLDVAHA